MAFRKSASCVLVAVVAAAAAVAMASAETTTVTVTDGETAETYDVAAATALALTALVDTATPVVVSAPAAAEKEMHPVVGAVNMTLPNGTLAIMVLHVGENAVTEVRRWLHAHNAVDADVDVKFRAMLAVLKVPGVAAVTPDTLLAYLPLTVDGGVTYNVPLLSSEAPEESVRGFLRRMDLMDTMSPTSTEEAVRAARELHTKSLFPLSLYLAGYNVIIDFDAKAEDMEKAYTLAAEVWQQHLNETVRAGMNKTNFLINVPRAMFGIARRFTRHIFFNAPWDATSPPSHSRSVTWPAS